MDEKHQIREIDVGEYLSDRRYWVVSDGNACNHADGDIDYVGSDGRNEYYQCSLCEAAIIADPS